VRRPAGAAGLRQVLALTDLVPLSVSSVGPLFSVAATGGVMAAAAGWWTLPAIAALAVPFVVCSVIFRVLNRAFPQAGASYHWSARILGRRASRFQAWILLLAYFTSIPPIAIPAASYTLALVAPGARAGGPLELLLAAFWIAVAAVPLLQGARPTARLTQAFFALELTALLALGLIGVLRWPALHVPVRLGPPPWGGMLVAAVVAATILDGWEVDSYAAEEAHRPRADPGLGGIVGCLLAIVFYGVLYPLLLGETPLRLLRGAANPLALWGQRLLPAAPWVVLVPVLASTAGGLWLTTFILTRALFAMGRDRLLPAAFARLNGRGAPAVAIVASLGAALAVSALQTLVASLGAFFNLVLSAAGFFLLAEFFCDALTATWFVTRAQGRLPPAQRLGRGRWALAAAAMFASAVMGGLLLAFFVVAPSALGDGIDRVVGALLALGVLFTWATRGAQGSFVFHGRDTAGGVRVGRARPRPPRPEAAEGGGP
jgi:amino acid transporter